MSSRDPLFSDLGAAEKILRGTAKEAAEGADKTKSAIDDLVESNDQLLQILSDVVDRLIEAESRIVQLEAR